MRWFRRPPERAYIPGELDEFEMNELGDYNYRLRKGIVHTPEYAERMRALQERFNQAERDRLRAEGWEQVSGSTFVRRQA